MIIGSVVFFITVYNFLIDIVDAQLIAKEGLGCFPENDMKPNSDDCSSFLMCNHQRYIKVDCPKLTHFDPKSKTCNAPDRVSFLKDDFVSNIIRYAKYSIPYTNKQTKTNKQNKNKQTKK